MRINEQLFQIVPLIALLLNAFLFMVCLSAKKNNLINAFMLLLLSITAWTGGSFCMRLGEIWPGPSFWYMFSMTGILGVCFTYYNFVHFYTNQKGSFLRRLWLVIWAVIIVLNLFEVFIVNPDVNRFPDGGMSFTLEVKPLLVFPVIAAICTVAHAIYLMLNSVKKDGVALSQYLPLIIGVFIMFCGVAVDMVPGMATLPLDTLSAIINACILYYALYKKRLLTLKHVTSSGSTYLIAAVFTTVILAFSYSVVENFYETYFESYAQYKTIVISVFFSILVILVYSLLRNLINNLFIKIIEARETDLKSFSQAINKTLDLDEILNLYDSFITENMDATFVYICVYDERRKIYAAMGNKGRIQAKPFEFRDDNPLITWLQKNGQTISYKDFKRTNSYRAMWESEKTALEELNVDMIVPILSDDALTGLTMYAPKVKSKTYSAGEINFMDSAAAIVAIAMKNASLYKMMQDEAQRDSLTNLYNRRYFMQKMKQDFDLVRFDTMALLLINFDDFRLYNELYGAYEGDYILKKFATILTVMIGEDGTVARSGGKEFMASLPFYDAQRATNLALRIKERLEHTLANVMDRGKRYLTFSAGICVYPTAASNLDEMLTYANMAVYTAKRNGKNRIEIYAPQDENDQSVPDAQSKRKVAENCAPTIFALTAAIDAKDHYTFNHSNNVSDYATALAKEIGLDSEHVEIIRQAGLMHDIGKIGIPDSILSKQSKLTDEEYEVMKQHVEGSIAMIRHIPSLDYVIPAAIGHHERWDGHGYPRGLSGEEIPVSARILCLADSFDAMTTKRPYRDALTVDESLQEIKRNLGKQFDPELGKVFIDLVKDGKVTVKQQGLE